MKAHQLYPELFCPEYLTQLFEEKIQLSAAVGRDGVRVSQFATRLQEEVDLILKKTANLSYRFTGYKERLIPKGPDKAPRQISIPTVRDRLTLRAASDLVTEVFEDVKLSPPHLYVKKIAEISKGLGHEYSYLRIDIENYYPSIDHKILLKKVRKRIRKKEIIHILDSAIKTPTGKSNSKEDITTKGVPQGLSISNILSSIYLSSLDMKYKNDLHYFRYVDDILILCKTKDAKEIYDSVSRELRRTAKLKCHALNSENSGKTRIETVPNGIDYLGFHIDSHTVSVRPSSYKRMFTNLVKVFTSYKYRKNKERFIWRLNLKISGCILDGKRLGWMFFFAQTEDTSQLKRLDTFVNQQLQEYNIMSAAKEIKTFTKTYHEIRYNQKDTGYIVNFDDFSLQQKIETICLLMSKDETEVSAWDIEFIEYQFKKCTTREAAELEKDLFEVFS